MIVNRIELVLLYFTAISAVTHLLRKTQYHHHRRNRAECTWQQPSSVSQIKEDASIIQMDLTITTMDNALKIAHAVTEHVWRKLHWMILMWKTQGICNG